MDSGTQGQPAQPLDACGPAEALEWSEAFLEYFWNISAGPAHAWALPEEFSQ